MGNKGILENGNRQSTVIVRQAPTCAGITANLEKEQKNAFPVAHGWITHPIWTWTTYVSITPVMVTRQSVVHLVVLSKLQKTEFAFGLRSRLRRRQQLLRHFRVQRHN